jgi:hypothetical protein
MDVIVHDPIYASEMDPKATRRQTRCTKFCDASNDLRILSAGGSGIPIGLESGATGMQRISVQGGDLGMPLTEPVYTVVVRKCYGRAGGSSVNRADFQVGIASCSPAERGLLPVESDMKSAHRGRSRRHRTRRSTTAKSRHKSDVLRGLCIVGACVSKGRISTRSKDVSGLMASLQRPYRGCTCGRSSRAAPPRDNDRKQGENRPKSERLLTRAFS